MSAVVLIPSIGTALLAQAVDSVLAQSLPARCLVVCDGTAHRAKVEAVLGARPVDLCVLPANTGAGGYSGHRIYAGFSYLVDEEYVFFLDEDNWYTPEHVRLGVEALAGRSLDWVHSLRLVASREGTVLGPDDCESLGRWTNCTGTQLIDTSTFALRRAVLMQAAPAWYGTWGQDRVFAQAVMRAFPRHACTGRHTLVYRLGGSASTVDAEFFRQGNAQMHQRHGARLPWWAGTADTAPPGAGKADPAPPGVGKADPAPPLSS